MMEQVVLQVQHLELYIDEFEENHGTKNLIEILNLFIEIFIAHPGYKNHMS